VSRRRHLVPDHILSTIEAFETAKTYSITVALQPRKLSIEDVLAALATSNSKKNAEIILLLLLIYNTTIAP